MTTANTVILYIAYDSRAWGSRRGLGEFEFPPVLFMKVVWSRVSLLEDLIVRGSCSQNQWWMCWSWNPNGSTQHCAPFPKVGETWYTWAFVLEGRATYVSRHRLFFFFLVLRGILMIVICVMDLSLHLPLTFRKLLKIYITLHTL